VILAEPGCGIPVVTEDCADGGTVLFNDRVIAGVSSRHFGDHAEANGVVVAASNQRRPCGRAERGGVELRVAQPRIRDPIQRWSRDDTTEGTRNTVALVVSYDRRMLGAPLGGTTVGGQYGLDCSAPRLITPPNAGGVGGRYFPSIVVVA
jgi:hypothetical protein